MWLRVYQVLVDFRKPLSTAGKYTNISFQASLGEFVLMEISRSYPPKFLTQKP